MTFPIPELDDRSFQDIVDEAKELIPTYTPEWTNHNVSDPGVALVELFAWMTESITYRLNQVPDRLYLKFLELMGLSLLPASPARTDITFWLSSTDQDVTVPAGTEVGTPQAADGASVVFLTERPVAIRQPVLEACMTWPGNTDESRICDRWNDLRTGTPIRIFSDEQTVDGEPVVQPPVPGDAVYFGFHDSLAGNVIMIDTKAQRGVGPDPTRPPLTFEIWTGQKWLAAGIDDAVEGGTRTGDRTGGFNRNGTILLYLPYRHEPRTIGERHAFWLRARVTEATPAYDESPILEEVAFKSLGGRAPAMQAAPAGREILGISDGTPGQTYRSLHGNVLPRRPGEKVIVLDDDASTDWTEVTDFADSTYEDRHYTWDSASGAINFGPSVRDEAGNVHLHGAVPSKGAQIVVAAYRHGGGARGNVAAGTVVVIKSTISYISRAENRAAARGGVDAETVDNLRVRGPMTLATGDRAVTARDFERLALDASPAIARARCEPSRRSNRPIHVYLVPRITSPDQRFDDIGLYELTPRREDMAAVTDYIEDRRLIGQVVHVWRPYYRFVAAAVRLVAAHGIRNETVRDRCLDALYHYLNPVTGGVEGDGWPWGGSVDAKDIASHLTAVPGVHLVKEVLLYEAEYDHDGNQPRDNLTGRDIGRYYRRVGEAPLSRIDIGAYEMVASAPSRHWVIVEDDDHDRGAHA